MDSEPAISPNTAHLASDAAGSIARYRGLVDQIITGIAEADLTGRFVAVNDRFCEIVGYARAELIGHSSMQEITHPDDLTRNVELFQRLVETGQPFEIEKRYLHKDGSEVWVHNYVSKIDAEGGQRPGSVIAVVADITARKETERQLAERAEFNQDVIDSIAANIAVIDGNGVITAVNLAWRQFAEGNGAPPEDKVGIGASYIDACNPGNVQSLDERAAVAAGIRDVLSGKIDKFAIEYPCHAPTAERWFMVTVSPLRRSGAGAVVVHQDVTERKRAEHALRESEENLHAALEGGGLGTWSWDPRTNLGKRDARVQELFGLSPEDGDGDTDGVFNVILAEDLPKVAKALESAQKRGGTYRAEFRVRLPDGTIRWLAGAGRGRFDEDGTLTAIYGINFDITERKEFQAKLQKANDELEQRVRERTSELAEINNILSNEIEERKALAETRADLLKRLVASQESERLRIARDLHDQLGQQLTALRLALVALRNDASFSTAAKDRLSGLQDIAEQIDSSVTYIASRLRPIELDDLGLVEALNAHANEWSQRFGVPVRFHSNMYGSGRLTGEVETHLYRIAQEALNNTVKHAAATEVSLTLERSENGIVLVIEDNGIGFDVKASREAQSDGHGFGLAGMAERANLIGALLELESKLGSGTTIYVSIPADLATGQL
jgi:PAS domain S-box-containing protein